MNDLFDLCLAYLGSELKKYKESNLLLNCKKCHFMVKEGLLLGHKVYRMSRKIDRVRTELTNKTILLIYVNFIDRFYE